MKYLLLLSALIFSVPGWAAETAATSAAPQASAQQPAAQAVPAAKHGKKKSRKHAKKHQQKAASASTLTCPTGCGPMVCGGITICVKNKPAPQCTPC